MKLLMAIVDGNDANNLIKELVQLGHRATRINSAGGFLRQGNATVLVGVLEPQVEEVLDVIKQTCHTRKQLRSPLPSVTETSEPYMPFPVEVQLGGATVFVLNVDRYERL